MKHIDLPTRKFCPVHQVFFDKDKSCFRCVSDGNKFPVEVSKDKRDNNLTNNLLTITNKSRRVYVKRIVSERFHSYRKKFIAVVDWGALFQYDEVPLRNGVSFKRINYPEDIVRVFRKSILITLRSSHEIKGLPVKEAKIKSDELVRSVLERLPSAIKVKGMGGVSSVHNAFINHPYAQRDIKVVDNNNEVRFISDNSHGNLEFEAVNTQHAVSDSEAIENDTLSLIDRGLTRDFLADSIHKLVEDRRFYAENLRSHVGAIRELAKGVSEFKSEVKSLRVRSLKSEWGW